jgi:hypothetical protein
LRRRQPAPRGRGPCVVRGTYGHGHGLVGSKQRLLVCLSPCAICAVASVLLLAAVIWFVMGYVLSASAAGHRAAAAAPIGACQGRVPQIGVYAGGTTSQPRKGDVTGCQFGALGACPVVPGGCPHPTGWWGHPNHCPLPREALGTRDPTTARHIRCLRGMRKARGGSPLRHHFAPAPRVTTHWVRLMRRAVLRAAPRAPGLASRALIYYSDPDLARQRGMDARRTKCNRF